MHKFLDLIDIFPVIVLLKPDFNCWSNFALSLVEHKVTTGTQRFVSVIANLPSPLELVITQVDGHIKKTNFAINQWHFTSSPKIA